MEKVTLKVKCGAVQVEGKKVEGKKLTGQPVQFGRFLLVTYFGPGYLGKLSHVELHVDQ